MNIEKTKEAVCYLLSGLDGKSTYGILTKLLYIADRECIRKHGRQITMDRMNALPHGPILSATLDNLNGSHALFSGLVSAPNGLEIRLLKNLEPNELTFSEVSILKKVLEDYGHMSWGEIKNVTHQFEEWKKYDKQSSTWANISCTDVAEGLDFSEEQIRAVESATNESIELTALSALLKVS